jgi:hypothetical protein
LRVKHLFIVVILLLSVQQVFGQKPKIENLPAFDRKRIHFGFTLGINSADFRLTPQPDFSAFDSLRVVEVDRQPGFNLGIIADLHLNTYFSLRFIPSLAFSQRNIEYTFFHQRDTTYSFVVQPIESTYLEFPLTLKYRSSRLNNFAAYVIGGGKYTLDLASQRDVVQIKGQEIVKINRHDFHYELGVGFDFFLEYFKFSPEIKMSFGLKDILIHDNTIYSDPIRRLNSRMFLISFHFEG